MPADVQDLMALFGGAARGVQAGQQAKAAQQAQALKLKQEQDKLDQTAAYQNGQIDVRNQLARIAGQRADSADWQGKARVRSNILNKVGAGLLLPKDADDLLGTLGMEPMGPAPGLPKAAPVGYLPPSVQTPPAPAQTAPEPQAGLPGNVPLPQAPQTSASAAAPVPPGAVDTGSSRVTIVPTGHMGPAAVQGLNTKKAQQHKAEADAGFTRTKDDTLQAALPYAGDRAYQADRIAQTKANDQGALDRAQVQHYRAGTAMDLATAQALALKTPAQIAQIRASTLAEGVRLQQQAQKIALDAQSVAIQGQNAKTNAGRLNMERWKAHNPAGGGAASAAKLSSAEINKNNDLIAGYDRQKSGIIAGAIDPKTGKGRRLSPGEQDLVDRADSNIRYYKGRNQQLMSGTAAVDPTSSPGYAVVPGQGRVPVPSVPRLPGFAPAAAPPHHSALQQRHPQTRQFVKAAPAPKDLSRMTTKDLMRRLMSKVK